MRRRLAVCAVLAGIGALARPAHAQAFPARPVRLVVPFPPGGATDIIGRLVAAKLQERWGQTVLVDNKPGAGSVSGTEIVARAPADGYTLGLVVTAHVINASLRSKLPYDTLRDFTPIGQVAQAHIVLAAHPSFAANTVAELVQLARRNPGTLSYASPGTGSALHLGMEMFKTAAGIDILHVPYKGGVEATNDVLGGRVPLIVDLHFAALPQLKAGKLKALGILSATRAGNAPDLPAIAETYPQVVASSLYGVVAPAGLPRDLAQRIGADLAASVRSADVHDRMAQLGIEAVASSPDQFDALIRASIPKWAEAVKASGARSD